MADQTTVIELNAVAVGLIFWTILTTSFFFVKMLLKMYLDKELKIQGPLSRDDIHRISTAGAFYVIVHITWGFSLPFTILAIGKMIPNQLLQKFVLVVPDYFLLCVVLMGLVSYAFIFFMWRRIFSLNLSGLFEPKN